MMQPITPADFKLIADYGIAFVLAFIILVILPLGAMLGLAVWRSNVAASKRQQAQLEFASEQQAEQLSFMAKKDAAREERESVRYDRMFALFIEHISPFGEIARGLQTSLKAQSEEFQKSQTREHMYLSKFDNVRDAIEDNKALGEELARGVKEEILVILKSMSAQITQLEESYPYIRKHLDGLQQSTTRIEARLDEIGQGAEEKPR